MELVKFSSAKMLPISAIVLAIFCTTEAALTAWTNPVVATATGGNGAATPSIPEYLKPGSTGVTIAATVTGTPTYSILTQPTAGLLTISSTTGLLSLASGQHFDYETSPTYEFTVGGVDSAVAGTTSTVTVTLSITNGAGPVFAKTQYSVTIPDGSKAGTSLVTAVATDADTANGDVITYTIDDTTNWAIDASTGAITVKTGKTLDQAATGGYKLMVTATDIGVDTATATVWVVVKTCSSAAIIGSGVAIFIALIVNLM